MKPKKPNIIPLFKPLTIYVTMKTAATRIGSLAILQKPSRFGHALFYPDGRIVRDKDIAHVGSS